MPTSATCATPVQPRSWHKYQLYTLKPALHLEPLSKFAANVHRKTIKIEDHYCLADHKALALTNLQQLQLLLGRGQCIEAVSFKRCTVDVSINVMAANNTCSFYSQHSPSCSPGE